MLNEKNASVSCSLEYCKQSNMKHQKVYTIVSVSISSSNYATLNTQVKLTYIKTNKNQYPIARTLKVNIHYPYLKTTLHHTGT